MGKPHKCSRCRRLRRGHVGPSGPKCKMSLPYKGDADPAIGAPNIHNKQEPIVPAQKGGKSENNGDPPHNKNNDQITGDKPPPVDPFLNELAAQLGQLTLNMQELNNTNCDLVADMAQIKSNSRSFPVDVRPSSHTSTSPSQHAPGPLPRNTLPPENRDAHMYGVAGGLLSGGPDSPVP